MSKKKKAINASKRIRAGNRLLRILEEFGELLFEPFNPNFDPETTRNTPLKYRFGDDGQLVEFRLTNKEARAILRSYNAKN